MMSPLWNIEKVIQANLSDKRNFSRINVQQHGWFKT